MTPEQDNELREQITPLVIEAIENGTFDGYYGDQIADETWNFLKALITADRKRVALEARLDELEHTFVSHDNALASELVENPEWEYGQVAERIAELKAQQEEV